LNGEGAGSPAQDSIGAIVGVLEREDDAASAQPEKGGVEEVGLQLLRQQVTQIMLAKKRKSRSIKVFQKIFEMLSTEISSPCKNSFGKTIGVPKTASAGERSVSSLGCVRSPRSNQGNSSAQVAAAAQA
jgi:hypothetical protein